MLKFALTRTVFYKIYFNIWFQFVITLDNSPEETSEKNSELTLMRRPSAIFGYEYFGKNIQTFNIQITIFSLESSHAGIRIINSYDNKEWSLE